MTCPPLPVRSAAFQAWSPERHRTLIRPARPLGLGDQGPCDSSAGGAAGLTLASRRPVDVERPPRTAQQVVPVAVLTDLCQLQRRPAQPRARDDDTLAVRRPQP